MSLQTEALMKGKDRATVEGELRAAGKSEQEIASIAPHKVGQHHCTPEQQIMSDVESCDSITLKKSNFLYSSIILSHQI